MPPTARSLAPVLADLGGDGSVELVEGSVADAPLVDRLVADHDVVVHFAAESHNDNSLDSPVALRARATSSAPSRSSRRSAGTSKRLHHISTDEVYGDLKLDDHERFTEQTPVNPSSPLLRHQGRRRPARPRLDPLLRHPRHRVELLEQLRSPPARREVHPAPDHERPRRHPAQGLRLGPQRARLDPRRRPQRRRHRDPRAGPPRRDLPHRRRRRAQQPRDRRDGPRAHGRPDDWFDHVDDRPGHDLRYAIDSTKLRLETDWKPRYGDVRAGLEATIEWYTAHRDWWEAAKVESERTYARLGR